MDTDFLRIQVGPDLLVVVDASCCILFEVIQPNTTTVLRRVTVTNADEVAGALATARGEVEGRDADEHARRYHSLLDVSRARDAVNAGAAEWARFGMSRGLLRNQVAP
jgi:hypothetical protein